VGQTLSRGRLPLCGRWVRLAPLTSDYTDALRLLLADEALDGLWPHAGGLDVARLAWNLGDRQYVVVDQRSGSVIGLVVSLDEERFNDVTSVGFVVKPSLWRVGWAFEALVLFINLMFETYGFRKLYFKMSDSTLRSVAGSIDKWLVKEATFVQHARVGGGYEDRHVYTLDRRCWDPMIVRMVTGGRVVP
jgi:Acetyltransferase (GNAT) domain